MTGVQVSLSTQRRLLRDSRLAEMPSFWPRVKGRRVKRLGAWPRLFPGLPVAYHGDPFQPRRELVDPQ